MEISNETKELKSAKIKVLNLAAAFVVLSGALAITVTSGNNPKTTIESRNSSVLGVSTASNENTVIVNKISTDEADSRTQSGMKRVTLAVSIKNTSGKQLQIAPGTQMQLVDEMSAVYNMTAGYTPNRLLGGSFDSGQTFNSDIDFEIPVSATPKRFIFQENANSPVSIINL
jgi:hypothetical protein